MQPSVKIGDIMLEHVSLLLSSSDDAFVDIVDDEASFELSPKTEFTSTFCVATDTERISPQLLQDLHNLLKLLAFKSRLSDLSFERECQLAMFI